jgi:hypothetical protein
MSMKRLFFLCLPILLMLSCSSGTKVTNSWNEKSIEHKPLNKVIIIALTANKDRTLREQLEQRLAESLSAEGYSTTSAYFEYGPKAFEGMKEQQVLRKLKTSGIDGVITVTILDKEKEKNRVPGSVTYQPARARPVRSNRFWGDYTNRYNRIYKPGYYTTSTKYFIETNLYDVTTNQLLYSAQSETFDPSSAQSLAADYSKAIVKDMKEKQLLKSNSASIK